MNIDIEVIGIKEIKPCNVCLVIGTVRKREDNVTIKEITYCKEHLALRV